MSGMEQVIIPASVFDGKDYRVELTTVFHDPASRPGGEREPVPHRVVCVVDRISHDTGKCSFCGKNGTASTFRVSGVECWRGDQQLPDVSTQITLIRDSLGRLFGDRSWACEGCLAQFLNFVQENVDGSQGLRLRSIRQATAA